MGYWSADAPEARNIGQESRDTLQAQVDLAPQQLAAAQATQPGYNTLALQNLNAMLRGTGGQPGLLEMYPELAKVFGEIDAAQQSRTRSADIGDVAALGPQATAAFRAANPELAQLTRTLTSQAQSELADPYALTPEQQRYVTQNTRAAMAARGMNGQNVGVGSEVLANYLASGQEAQRRRASAYQAAALEQATSADPFMAILGRQGNAANQSIAGMGQTNSTANSANIQGMFDPFSQYGAGVGAQNNDSYNTWLANKATGAQRATAVSDSVGSFVGSVAKGMMCWVAREVYADGPRWRVFREWLIEEAPAWFYRLYRRHGERFAAWIHDKPRLKAVIRWWMDGRVENYLGRKALRWHNLLH